MKDLMRMVEELQQEIQQLKLLIQALSQLQFNRLKSEWLTPDEVCRILNMSENSLMKLRNSKMLPFSKIGQKIYYRVADIQALLLSKYNGKAA